MCYASKYGPQNRPSDVDLKARNTGLIKSADPKKNCPRCGGGVFSNEEIKAKNASYHKKCATCILCEAMLTHNTVYDGEDNNIYCKFCYHRKFAPVGYRGAGCADWVDGESNNVLRHSFQAF
jgi:transcription elongation factor Elf1